MTEKQCGCTAERKLGSTQYTINMCPLHKAAPAMYEALKNLIDDYESRNACTQASINKAKRDIAKAEGK